MKEQSIRNHLKFWLAVCCCVLAIASAAFISLFSYVEGKDTQDEVLTHFANIINKSNLKSNSVNTGLSANCSDEDVFLDEVNEFWVSVKELLTSQEVPGLEKPFCENLEDTRLVVEEILEGQSPTLGLAKGVQDGFHNIKTPDERWRVLIKTTAEGQFAVAQSIEARNKLIFDNTLLSVSTILVFAFVLLFFMNWTVSYLLKPIEELSGLLDSQDPKVLEPIKVSRNIKEISPFIEAINRLVERMNFQSKAEKRFVSDASHELRTPISAIYLQFENLEFAQSEQERLDRIAQLKLGILRVRHLLEQLLNLSKIRSTGVDNTRSCPLNQQVQESVTLLYPLAEKKSIDLGISNDISAYSQAVNSSAAQVISNAISNAIAHTPEKGKIDVTIESDGDLINIVVEDSGPGIPDSEKERVTQAFFSGEGSKSSGAGLGLTISNEISKRLSGQIEFKESRLGGLRFIFSLPRN